MSDLKRWSQSQIDKRTQTWTPTKQTFKKRSRTVQSYAKSLRNNQTEWERVLVRTCRSLGVWTEAQYIKGYRIVDVYLPQLDVALEADGAQHFTPAGQEYDNARAADLRHRFPTMTTLRYRNSEISASPEFKERLLADLLKAGGFSVWPYRIRD